jgi:uncharacterized protein YecE (DUF72 family)
MGAPLYIGTSGWSYKHWGQTFFPHGMKSAEQLSFYAQRFNSVEINATHYRLPFGNMVKGWHDRAPDGFIFAVKGHRLITHYKKLKHAASNIDLFLSRVKGLKEHFGPILWQLPPQFHADTERLERFLKRLPIDRQHAVEFRHPSWLMPIVFKTLRRYNVAFVSVSSTRMPEDFSVTADFVYVRFHGLAGGASHDYTRRELEPWQRHLVRQLDNGRTAFAYFNNDINTRAPGNAEALRSMVLGGATATRPAARRRSPSLAR